VREPDHNEFVENDTPKAEAGYRDIRNMTDDVPNVAAAANLDPSLVHTARQNLFVNTHDVAVGPGDIRHGYFRADETIADLWKEAASGRKMTPERANMLRSLIAHEVVEAKLIEAGVPYNFAEPRLWGPDKYYDFSPEHAGAHQVAPRSLQSWDEADLLRHWRALGLTPPAGGIARDLSNLDEVVRTAIEGMGW